ncbi:MAG TPA: O-antigen ligase family protein [Phycisphaerae bacterium]|nr:O-antigen ligase family protein [Phycisphaerae bacterium]
MTRAIESCCLYLILLVVALRPLIPESYSSSRSSISAGLTAISDPAPATTLILDAVILLAATGWLVARALGPARPYRRCGIEWGAVLVLVAGIASCCVAGNKRLAVNGTVDWLMLPLLTIVLAQLLRERWHVRLALAVIVASAAVQAYECFNQIVYTYPATEELYEEQKEEFWAAQDIDLDSSHVALYERRMHGREATGYLAHSNVAGAYLVLTGLAALAVAWSRWRSAPLRLRRPSAVLVGLVGAAILAAAALTHSRGALFAGAAAVVVWIIRVAASSWIERKRTMTLLFAWSIIIGGAIATIGQGLQQDKLPGASLNFRWQYWTASARLFADTWTTGVGRENFGRHYLQYKTIASPEEVTNPHNFLVSAATEWGVIGLAGMVVMLVGGSIALTRPSKPYADDPTERPGSPLRWALAVGGGVFFLRLFLLGSTNVDYLIVVTVLPLFVWMVAFALLSVESNILGAFRTDGLPRLAVGVNLCLLAFVLQDTINFAAFVPGAATTFFALLAIPIASRSAGTPEPAVSKRRAEPAADAARAAAGGMTRWWLVGGAVVVLLAHVAWNVAPVSLAGTSLASARRAGRQVIPGQDYYAHPAYIAYDFAESIDQSDPTPPAECAAWLVGHAEVAADREAAITRALELIDEAITHDPCSTSLHRQKLRMCRRFFDLTGERRYRKLAVSPAQRIVELYPQSPEAHADLGAALLDAARESRNAVMLGNAVKHLQRALDLDDARPEWEELRRLRLQQREDIEARIAEAAGLLHAPS